MERVKHFSYRSIGFFHMYLLIFALSLKLRELLETINWLDALGPIAEIAYSPEVCWNQDENGIVAIRRRCPTGSRH